MVFNRNSTTIWITEHDQTCFPNHLLCLSLFDTIDPQRDVTCLYHLLRRAYLMMFDRRKTWRKSKSWTNLLKWTEMHMFSREGLYNISGHEEDDVSEKRTYNQEMDKSEI